jgi:hypothetical protein
MSLGGLGFVPDPEIGKGEVLWALRRSSEAYGLCRKRDNVTKLISKSEPRMIARADR